jgi:hypothetical protein
MSVAARHVRGMATGVEPRSGEPSPVLPLLLMVIGLSAAAVWFVALPALEEPPPGRTCEVYVLRSGATKCVPKPGTHAVAKAKGSRGVKR